MRISKIVCDRCGKEIEGNPVKILPNYEDRETGDFQYENPFEKEIKECDFCDECTMKIIRYAKGGMKINQEFEKAVEDMVNSQKEKETTVKEHEPESEQEKEPEPTPEPEPVEEPKETQTEQPVDLKSLSLRKLVLMGIEKKKVCEIKGCTFASYDNTKYVLKKKGLLKEQTPAAETETKTYKCSKVGSKCKYGYKGRTNGTCCDYISIEGHSRGCDPEECTKFAPRKRGVQK